MEATNKILLKVMKNEAMINLTYLGTATKAAFQDMFIKEVLYGKLRAN